ncbi:hypothetical protein SAMN04515674_1361 [Pseudarcicella hirudinis]|uniref:Uncharacterized protein n=1 Tax=Pseudarcicella hirudinis TaxID=1079859 RepID=A0A1I5Z5R5_9BACT|nr:hypothetical protein [Pseudarcicella hirudinis]SFQ51790.1 hypothetical protein SAMN04515674_1361 [Pseudarcicella hirudinis]
MDKTRIQTAIEATTEIRRQLNISKEQLFWAQVNFGCAFLEYWFPEEALKIAVNTNFWDLFIMQWNYDDVHIRDEFKLECKDDYWRFKFLFFNDEKMLKTLDDLMEYKHENKHKQTTA